MTEAVPLPDSIAPPKPPPLGPGPGPGATDPAVERLPLVPEPSGAAERAYAATAIPTPAAGPGSSEIHLITTHPAQPGSGLRRLRAIGSQTELSASLRTLGRALEGDGPRYAVEGVLGRGAHGSVYAVRDHDCRRQVAMKVLHANQLKDHDVERFIHEAQVTAQLEHPGVVPVHELSCLPDGTVYYAMKRISGRSLAQVLRSDGGQSHARFRLLEIMVRVCETLSYAHSRGVIHRDLKPANLMIGQYGEVLLCDWGLAKVTGAGEPVPGEDLIAAAVTSRRTTAADDPCATAIGFALGTPAYMAPEQARGELARIDARSDLYACGVILYEMLAGVSPYDRSGAISVLDQVSMGRWRSLPRLGIPAALRAIVHRCLAPEPDRRYQSADALAADIRSWLAGDAVSAYRESLGEQFLRVLVRHRTSIGSSAVAAAIAIAIALATWGWLGVRTRQQIDELRGNAGRAELSAQWGNARTLNERLLALAPDDRDAQRAIERCTRIAAQITQQQRASEVRTQATRLRSEASAHRQRAEVSADPASALAAIDAAEALYQQALGLLPAEPELHEAVRGLALRRKQLEDDRLVAERRQRAADLRRRASVAESQEKWDAMIQSLEAAMTLEATAEDAERLKQAIARQQDNERQNRERVAAEGARKEKAAAHARNQVAAAALIGGLPELVASQHFERAAEVLSRAMALDPERSDGGMWSARISDGRSTQIRADADQRLTEAAHIGTEAVQIETRLITLNRACATLEARLRDDGASELRAPLAERERERDLLARRHASLLQARLALLLRAEAAAPGYAAPRSALADYYTERLIDADIRSSLAEAEAAAVQVAAWDDGSRRDVIAGFAMVAVPATAPAVRLIRVGAGPDRTWVTAGAMVQLAPGSSQRLAQGRWLANAGSATVALGLRRGQLCNLALPLTVPPAGTAIVAVIAGASECRIERAFVLARREVTCSEWLAFINDAEVLTRIIEDSRRGVLTRAPRAAFDAESFLWRQRANGSFALELADGSRVHPDAPVAGICYEDALAFVAWRARRDGLSWRLPTTQEWSIAVSGGDGRFYPWGDAADPTLCASALTSSSQPLWSRPGQRFPADVSVHGIADLAGSVAEFCSAESGQRLRPVMGGSYLDRQPERFAATSRREWDARYTGMSVGLRLACDLR